MLYIRAASIYLCIFLSLNGYSVGSRPAPVRSTNPDFFLGDEVDVIDPVPPAANDPLSIGGSLKTGEPGSAASGAARVGAMMRPGFSLRDEAAGNPARGSEFISGYYKGAVLMPVRLWGAVRQAGLHQVPSGTDIMQLITLAGGPNADAEMDQVTIKRFTKTGFKVIKLDLKALVESAEQNPIELEPNDTIVVPASKPIIDQNTLTVISVVTSVVGIVASSVLIANQVK